jgi:hypothetical protein
MTMHLEISMPMLEQQLPPLNWSQLIVVKAFPQGGKTGSWKNLVIISLLVMVFGLWMRLSMSY